MKTADVELVINIAYTGSLNLVVKAIEDSLLEQFPQVSAVLVEAITRYDQSIEEVNQ